tara:strand:- start:4574 stop:5086 length:513 start_codon:yes stop_codon:yes gene_type:complete
MGEIPSQSMLSALNTAPVAESEDHKGNFTKVFSADIVEGMLAEGMGEIKRSLDVLYYNPGNMEQHVNAAACRSITLGQVENMLHFLEPYHDASLRPRHRGTRRVLCSMRKRLLENVPLMDQKTPYAGFDVLRFGRDMVQFLTAFHKVLSVSTSTTDRNNELRWFCRGVKK